MELTDFCKRILTSGNIDHKVSPEKVRVDSWFDKEFETPIVPARSKNLSFSDKNQKFPKVNQFHRKDIQGKVLHFFANHELMAIEMMAAALLKYPVHNENDLLLKKGILKALADEQKHFSMYRAYMNKVGVEFGDFHVNGFFWNYMNELNSLSEFCCLMALTFENANLDFSSYYQQIFSDLEEHELSRIMEVVFIDEITHVALGARYLSSKNENLWNYYCENLPKQVSPARAKGIVFNREARVQAKLDKNFIDQLENFRGDFQVTKRRSWEK